MVAFSVLSQYSALRGGEPPRGQPARAEVPDGCNSGRGAPHRDAKSPGEYSELTQLDLALVRPECTAAVFLDRDGCNSARSMNAS